MKSEVISFRLSSEEYEKYRVAIEKSGISKSEFFRSVFLDLSPVVELKEAKNKNIDYKKLVFLVNKSSNNLNQIAFQLNAGAKQGIITQSVVNRAINYLFSIEKLLKKAVRNAS